MVLLKSVCESTLEHSSWAPLAEEERPSPFISWAASLLLAAHCSTEVCRTFVRDRVFCSVFMRSHYLPHLGLLDSNYFMFSSSSYLNLMKAVHLSFVLFCLGGEGFWGGWRVFLFCFVFGGSAGH